MTVHSAVDDGSRTFWLQVPIGRPSCVNCTAPEGEIGPASCGRTCAVYVTAVPTCALEFVELRVVRSELFAIGNACGLLADPVTRESGAGLYTAHSATGEPA